MIYRSLSLQSALLLRSEADGETTKRKKKNKRLHIDTWLFVCHLTLWSSQTRGQLWKESIWQLRRCRSMLNVSSVCAVSRRRPQ